MLNVVHGWRPSDQIASTKSKQLVASDAIEKLQADLQKTRQDTLQVEYGVLVQLGIYVEKLN